MFVTFIPILPQIKSLSAVVGLSRGSFASACLEGAPQNRAGGRSRERQGSREARSRRGGLGLGEWRPEGWGLDGVCWGSEQFQAFHGCLAWSVPSFMLSLGTPLGELGDFHGDSSWRRELHEPALSPQQ